MAQLSIGINVLAPAPLFPLIMDEYSLDRSTVSILVAVMALMLAVGNVPSGFLAARFGIHRTFAVGAFLMSAGTRFTVILRRGNSQPELRIAALTRSLASCTAVSGSPTIVKEGSPGEISTSTSTM